MNRLIFIIIFFVIANIISFSQRNRTPDGRGPESEIKQRIDRIDNNHRNPVTRNPQRTIVHQQQLPEKTNPPKTHVVSNVHVDPHFNQPDCIVKNPDKFSFPDRVYQINGIEFILQKFLEEDYDGAIVLLSEAIEEKPFVPDFYFLRGIAYIKRESIFKKSDYYSADSDFLSVKILEHDFPNLSYYIKKVYYLLHPEKIVITR